MPDGCEVSTFYAYVRGEQTPVLWLPEVRPLHYAALHTSDTTLAQQLAPAVVPDTRQAVCPESSCRARWLRSTP